jgi:hypothetical protein
LDPSTTIHFGLAGAHGARNRFSDGSAFGHFVGPKRFGFRPARSNK